ncbi:ABC transporter permease [Kitasatospora sp. NBC_00240]|uniref:FtsX-like permease family protein n=1 Tax=Kitasatospora sp. NBC_00240 TaxID=2903567 RepID=UPI002251EA35|nr:ABC transporter permease [Kitasatospora sp. NBC_00240]MCX5209053.1 ABC transporter permease [Kitasatospora sp. NBC_00240]
MLGFVLRRLRGRLPLAAAVLVTVLITTAMLTAIVAFNRTVGEAGLRQALQGPGRNRTTVLVTGERAAPARSADDAAVRAFADELFGPLPARVESVARSRSYGLPAAGPEAAGPGAGRATDDRAATGKDPDLTVLVALDRGQAHLLAGRWPQSSARAPLQAAGSAVAGAAVEVAVPPAALARLGLTAAALPASVTLADRFQGGPLAVLVTGVYQAADRTDPYWRLDPLGGAEVQVSSFTTYGPMLVDDAEFTSGPLLQSGRSWLVRADFGAVRPDEAEALRLRTDPASAALQHTAALRVQTELADLLGELKSAAVVARSTVLIGALQLAVLGAAALLLVVTLLTGRQESENALLAARGASRGRIGLLTAAESVLLALPAAVLAPLLTPPLLHLLGRFGPLSRVSLDTSLPWILWPVAAACALACVLLTTLPGLVRGAGVAALRRAGRRQAAVAGAARSGADLALLALAFLAYRQLARQSGGALAAETAGRLGVDPVLVAAPTLALCAGTLLVLRLLPFAARLGGRWAARGRGLAPALVGWQFARRPGRATGPVLLLVLAVSTGVLALGQHSAWSASQRDQADFATAGGLRITGSGLAAMGQGGRYAALPGGERLIPVVRADQSLPGGGTGRLLALDAAGAAAHLQVRSDLFDGRGTGALLAPLVSPEPQGPEAGVPLPGHPARIDLEVGVRVLQRSVVAGAADPSSAGGPVRPGLWLMLRDRFGTTYRTLVPGLPTEGDAKVSVDLAALTDAPLGSVATPLTLTGLVVGYGWPGGERIDGELTVGRIAVADTVDGPAVAAPVGADWSPTPAQGGAGAPVTLESLPADQRAAGTLFRLRYHSTPADFRGVRVPMAPAAGAPLTSAGGELPGLATRDYLTAVGASVGDLVRVPFGGARLPVRITAAVDSVPVAGRTALVLDLASAGRLLAATGVETPVPNEWWLPAASAHDPRPAAAAAVLRSAPGSQLLHLREEIVAGLLEDPVSAAPQTALAALAVATAVLAAIGFAAAAAAASAERAGEFAVLLALGVPRRRLTRTVAAEQAVLVGLGTTVGIGLGALIVRLIVPLVVLTPAARRPVPDVLVGPPLGQTLLLAAAIGALPLLSAFLGARRRRNPAARLRLVEEM